jgi:hypothetical protein
MITHQPGAASPAECVPIIPHGQSGQHTEAKRKEKEMKSKDRQRQKLFEAGGLGDSLASGFVTPSSISSSSLCLDVQSGAAAGLGWAELSAVCK